MKQVILLLCIAVLSVPNSRAAGIPKVPNAVREMRERQLKVRIERSLGTFGATVAKKIRLDESIFEKKDKKGFEYLFTPEFREKGLTFLGDYKSVFDYAEPHFGVPRSVIAAAPAIEWWYADRKLWPVADALFTQAVLSPWPKKRSWAERELIIFLSLSDATGWDALAILGSWEGAFGIFQFMASSYRADAMRWTGSECVRSSAPPFPDPFNPADVICSVANYLHLSGWSKTEASHRRAVWAYNHWTAYVNAFLDYADILEGRHSHRYRRKTVLRAAIK